MPRGGARQGAGRKPFPDFKPEGIVIDVRNCTAYVSRWERVGAAFQLVPADNWNELEDAAADEVSTVGGYITMSGIYPCSAELASKGEWTMNSNLTDNAWVKRVDEIRQMVADVPTAPETADDANYYIDEVFELTNGAEIQVARQEFTRQYNVKD